MEPGFWLNLQKKKNWDLWYAEKEHVRIKPFVLHEQSAWAKLIIEKTPN